MYKRQRWHSGIKDYYYDRGFCANPVEEDRTFSLDTQLREFPESGQGDFRSPAYELEDRNGDRNARFFYQGFQILKGKTAPEGLPHVYTEQVAEEYGLKLLAQIPIDPKIAQMVDGGQVEYIEMPWFEEAVKAVENL